MLLEAPNIAAAPYSIGKNMISRFYRRMMETFERQGFVAPPIDTNDLLVRAANALHNSDWRQSLDYIKQLRIWKGIRGVPSSETARILAAYEKKIKEASMVVWIFVTADHFKSHSLSGLAEQFDLSEKTVRAIAGKLILRGRIVGYIDKQNDTLEVETTGEPNSLLHYGLFRLEKKVGQRAMVENNEKLLAILEAYVKKAQEEPKGKKGRTLAPDYKQPGAVKHTRKFQANGGTATAAAAAAAPAGD